MKITRNNLQYILSVLISMLILLSCVPVIFTGIFTPLIITILTLYTVSFLLAIHLKLIVIQKSNVAPLLYTIFLALYIAVPFRVFDRFSPSVVWLLIFPTLFLLPSAVVSKASKYFEQIVYIISVFALFIYILHALNIISPFYVIDMGGRLYDSYFFSTILQDQYFSIGGLSLYRSSGIFGEPGHFGLIIAFLFYLNPSLLKVTKGKIILLAGLLTLSFSFYVLLLILLVTTSCMELKFKNMILLSFILLIILFLLPSEVIQSFFISKAEGALDNRTSYYFRLLFDNFWESNEILYGWGRDVLDEYNLASSDYRAFIIRYGLIGIILYAGLLFTLKFNKRDLLICLLYTFVVFIHRSWFVDYFIFLFFIISMSSSIKLNKNEI